MKVWLALEGRTPTVCLLVLLRWLGLLACCWSLLVTWEVAASEKPDSNCMMSSATRSDLLVCLIICLLACMFVIVCGDDDDGDEDDDG